MARVSDLTPSLSSSAMAMTTYWTLYSTLFSTVPRWTYQWRSTEPQSQNLNPRDPQFCFSWQQSQQSRFSSSSPLCFPPPAQNPASFKDANSTSKSISIGATASTARVNTADRARVWVTKNPASGAPSKKPFFSAGTFQSRKLPHFPFQSVILQSFPITCSLLVCYFKFWLITVYRLEFGSSECEKFHINPWTKEIQNKFIEYEMRS